VCSKGGGVEGEDRQSGRRVRRLRVERRIESRDQRDQRRSVAFMLGKRRRVLCEYGAGFSLLVSRRNHNDFSQLAFSPNNVLLLIKAALIVLAIVAIPRVKAPGSFPRNRFLSKRIKTR